MDSVPWGLDFGWSTDLHTQGWVRVATQAEEGMCGSVAKSGEDRDGRSSGKLAVWSPTLLLSWLAESGHQLPHTHVSKPLPHLKLLLPQLPLSPSHPPGPWGSSQPLTVLCLPQELVTDPG